MIKRSLYIKLIAIAIVIVMMPGCSDRLDMEDANLPLALGLDLDPEDNPVMYSTFPVFSKNIKKKNRETKAKAPTFRESRAGQDAHSSGVFTGRNYQVFVVGKRLLSHDDWFQMTDVIFRDSKNTVADRVIYFDGPLSDLIYLNPKDQPMLPLLLRGMVDTKAARSETVKTTVQELHRQMFERGITPCVAKIELNKKEITLRGTALLNHKGKYVASLDASETVLLRILQNRAKKAVSLTLSLPGETRTDLFATDKLSFSADKVKTKTKVAYRRDKFQFNLNVNMLIGLTEKLIPYDVQEKGKELEQAVSEQIQKQLEAVVKKFQKYAIDPIGLGLYARAYEYQQYKKVQDHWGEALAQADIHVSVKVTLRAMGPVK